MTPDHFWSGRTTFSCQNRSGRTIFSQPRMVQADHFSIQNRSGWTVFTRTIFSVTGEKRLRMHAGMVLHACALLVLIQFLVLKRGSCFTDLSRVARPLFFFYIRTGKKAVWQRETIHGPSAHTECSILKASIETKLRLLPIPGLLCVTKHAYTELLK